MWDVSLDALAEAGHRVVRCDLRGFGETPIDAPHTHAEDVRALLDSLGVERAAVVGSSFGGKVALELAVLHPERVSALALLCAGAPGHEPSADLRAFGTAEDAFLEAGDVAAAVDLNVDFWLGPDADEAARELVRLMQRRAFDVQLAVPEENWPVGAEVAAADLARISVPVLAVSGAQDVDDFRQIAVRLAETLPDARHLVLDWAGHLPSLERPAETAELLTRFLAGVTAPGAAGR